ncbi:ATP-binding protein [Psychromonas sp. RZ22]|uniref:ATP-binding protein n=1 Tax=Psychromonas algarum TaxID=2555643 RepID=UPI001067FAB6|nr:ATP-binding protein [Psychromonas sp. RZ22]TEW53557.1 ATP-binding protein [Psychromonas sp. RZ22]
MNIGKIISVNYNQFKVKVSSEIRGNSINLNGDIYYFGNIGSYLKSTNAVGETIVSEVMSIFDNDLQYNEKAFDLEGNRELLLKPIGTISRDHRFSLGVGVFPSLYSNVGIITFKDMEVILGITANDKENRIHQSFSLGKSKSLINYPIDINIDKFFNIHSAVLGNSGSGKSNTIAHIIQEIHKKQNNTALGSRILVFDVNGEYQNAFKYSSDNSIKVKLYKPNLSNFNSDFKPFCLPHFLMSIDEWSAFLLATEATQRPFWDKVLQEAFIFYKLLSNDGNEVAKTVDYLRYKICSIILNIINQGDSDTTNITTASSIIASLQLIINSNTSLKLVANQSELSSDLETLKNACRLSYGSNNDELLNKTKVVIQKINSENVDSVVCEKLPHGEYFDYKFLKIASNLALLEEDSRGNKRMREYTSTMLTRLDYFLENTNCEFMRARANASITDAKSFLDDFWDFDENNAHQTQMVIIDTSELSPDSLETLTSVTSRLIFEERKQYLNKERREKPIHLILDEAHRYIKKDYQYVFKENIFEKIAREGRKYSLYLLVSSQRPSELSETVLSQCANFIIHRIQNEVDMRYVYAILPFFSDDFVNKIKQSVPGEALVFGNCVSMPLHLKVHEAKPAPDSENCKISEEWFKAPLSHPSNKQTPN